MPLSLEELLGELDTHVDRIPLDQLVERLQHVEIDRESIDEYVRFGPETYRRNLLHEGPGYQALILCWRAGQRSPIHDHRGSSCGVRVIEGRCTETVFQRNSSEMLMATRSRVMTEGDVCGSQDADMHQVSNLEAGPLITLHVYSPPLMRMSVYSLTDTSVIEVEDPVYAFCDGAGI